MLTVHIARPPDEFLPLMSEWNAMFTNLFSTLMTVAPPGPAVPNFPLYRREVSWYYGLGKDDGDAYVTRNGALGAPTFLNGPVTPRETAYEMSYLRVLYTFDEKKR